MIFKGKTRNKFDYFKVLNNIKLDETNIILIEGETLTGGIQVGLLNNENSWSKYLAQITTQGNFRILFKITKNEKFEPVIAHHSNFNNKNHFVINKFHLLHLD